MAVLIPARNEESLLPRCLASVLAALRALPEDVNRAAIVVVDSSTDRSYELAKNILRARGTALVTDAGSVGVARALAARSALDQYRGDVSQCWLANTDADCEVPEHWLVDQLLLANAGADIVAGVVDVQDFSDHQPGVEQRFRETYLIREDGTHPHVHGANLGIRASAYLGVGGWASLCTAEDHDLWNRAAASGYRNQSVAHLKVLTSGRRIGRAPDGFALALAAHNEAFT